MPTLYFMDVQVIQQIQRLRQQAASLLMYQSVLDAAPGRTFLALLDSLCHAEPHGLNSLRAYGQWFQALATQGQSWPMFLLGQILRADNPFTQQAQQRDWAEMPAGLVAAAQHDLQALQTLYQCERHHISRWVQAVAGFEPPLAVWDESWVPATIRPQAQAIWQRLTTTEHWPDEVAALAHYHRTVGVGLFAEYHAFRWQAGQLVGIAYPDPVCLDQLVGYELPRAMLLKNTEGLLAGFPALHVLLYGSRGSGKSSLVKALVHEYGDRGLRLIEVAKADLGDLVTIVDRLRGVPQAFIIFVDDLSFEEDDDAFKALKVVLEGNLTARPQNVAVYATSNRRHLVREFFDDRPRPRDADEINAWDTVQEKLSFSDRFGLTLTFEPADQTTYLAIVHHLAAQAGLGLPIDELDDRALQWATRHNGRSGRTARQFIDFLRAELALGAATPSPSSEG